MIAVAAGSSPAKVLSDEFYDSLDRVLSSASASSSSDDESADTRRRRYGETSLPCRGLSSLDVWLSSPDSVAERRRRLHLMLGLCDDGLPDESRGPDSSAPVGAAACGETEECRRRLIKNLDDGSEFVVEEDEGLREVGTGRNLTFDEFELCFGSSPLVRELMRRQPSAEFTGDAASMSGSGNNSTASSASSNNSAATTPGKKRAKWFRSFSCAVSVSKGGAHGWDRRSSDEKETSSEKTFGQRSSSATDDSQDGSSLQPEKIKVRQCGKLHKHRCGLYMNQHIQAHVGAIWCIKFSPDGKYLASAGEDRVIHLWDVMEVEKSGSTVTGRRMKENVADNLLVPMGNESPEPTFVQERSSLDRKQLLKVAGRKSGSRDRLMVPDYVFALSEKPICSFSGHSSDILAVSWSNSSMYLLSSSMDKTVRLWCMSSSSCLNLFYHSDYVTCIQFNPVNDQYFISGSLDGKVRIWSIPDHQIVGWTDVREMVTAACYTPDGQSALVGSHKGSCHLYDASECKLVRNIQIDLQNKKRKSRRKKITGFEFIPGNSSKVLITSADSRIRVVHGAKLVHKFKGFRNRNSQISACWTSNGRYVISASEDSNVYLWQYNDDSEPNRSKAAVSVSSSYEYFHCPDVTVATVWPSMPSPGNSRTNSTKSDDPGMLTNDSMKSRVDQQQRDGGILGCSLSQNGERSSATWPEEIVASNNASHPNGEGLESLHSVSGLVIVTAGRGGEIRVLQNSGHPVCV